MFSSILDSLFCRQTKKGLRVGLSMSVFGFALMVLAHEEFRSADSQAHSIAEENEKQFRLTISVEEVRLDVVVLKRGFFQEGPPVTDLTAEDFEVYQDGQPQKINTCIFIDQTEPAQNVAASTVSLKDPLIPSPMPTWENTRRTITFLIDDMSMDMDPWTFNINRRSLEEFVKNKMRPGDLGTIMLTNRTTVELQLYSTDRRQLLGMIHNLRPKKTLPGVGIPQMTAISHCIKAMKDLPGRKYLYVLTKRLMIPGVLHPEKGRLAPGSNPFNLIADMAMRSGIVIYFVSDSLPTNVADYGNVGRLNPDTGEPVLPSFDALEQIAMIAMSREINPLPRKTGGDFLIDVEDAAERQKGYYLLSYTPPADTYKDAGRNIYHRVEVKVKRWNARVHARDGFLTSTQPLGNPDRDQRSLREALFSPIPYDGLKVHLASGYAGLVPNDYVLRFWMHVDAEALTINKARDGSGIIVLDAACVASDVNEYAAEGAGILRYDIRIPKENLAWVRKHGLKFQASFPMKQPGAYFVRAGVQDAVSRKIGSVYQFVEIPNLKNRRPALSSIFVLHREEDASWIHDMTNSSMRVVLQPDLRRESGQNQALRNYRPGESMAFMAFLYNAHNRDFHLPELVSQYTLLKDSMEYFKSDPEEISLSGVTDFTKIPIVKKLILSSSMPPGRYVLLLQVTDKKQKLPATTQVLEFVLSETNYAHVDANRAIPQASSNNRLVRAQIRRKKS